LLILPLHKKPTRENFPWITVMLLLANVAVFFFLQGGDHEVEQAAAQRYSESGVLANEWSWFTEWAEFTDRGPISPEELDDFFGEVGESEYGDQVRLMIMDGDGDFVRAIERGTFVDLDSPEFERWQDARQQLRLDREESFTRRYLLRYDRIEPTNLLTHMFMHGGLGHLIGNMLFLVLLGLLVEGALGRTRYLGAYLISGLAAAAASLSMNWGIDNGGLGASGAIAGLMGLFAVMYGRRKVRFFYWAFVYFDYVKAPALILLPLWLGWEVVSFLISDGANIAYEAHIGGLVCGALLGLLLVRTGQVDEAFMDADADHDEDREAVVQASQALDRLDAVTAKRLLRPLLTRHPREPRLLSMYLAACRLRVDDPDLALAVRRILQLPGDDQEQKDLVIKTFNHFRKSGFKGLKLPMSVVLNLAGNLIRWQELDAGVYLVDRLLRSKRPVPELSALCQSLADALQAGNINPEMAQRYRQAAVKIAEPGSGLGRPQPQTR
jgi:membrane associated rhomboid family serine protease